jgi:hypothetical protein
MDKIQDFLKVSCSFFEPILFFFGPSLADYQLENSYCLAVLQITRLAKRRTQHLYWPDSTVGHRLVRNRCPFYWRRMLHSNSSLTQKFHPGSTCLPRCKRDGLEPDGSKEGEDFYRSIHATPGFLQTARSGSSQVIQGRVEIPKA